MVSRLLIKSYRDKDYRLNLRHRFGMYKKSKSKEVVWFHAVSLGEVISSQQIVIEILKSGLLHFESDNFNDVVIY